MDLRCIIMSIGLAWLSCGFCCMMPFWLDGIYQEVLRKPSYDRDMIFVPTMSVSWALIIPVCLLSGPLARRVMKKFFGLEHDYFNFEKD